MSETTDSAARRETRTACAAHIYPHGTVTDRGHIKTAATAKRRKRKMRRRTAIRTFSRASAARLRRYLAETKGPEEWVCFGATLTIPGPVITPGELRRIFAAFRQHLRRLHNIALIYRVEMQERGQPHIHCVCWGKFGQGRLRECWDDAMGLLGACEGPANIDYEGSCTCGEEWSEYKPGWAKATTRWLWPGAREHAVRTDGLGRRDNIGWWRYLAAHTSKSKQAQLGWQGRQWGAVNKDLLERADSLLVELPDKAMDKVIRYLLRLTRCRFASCHGRQTWFTNPETVRRLCEWAKAETGG